MKEKTNNYNYYNIFDARHAWDGEIYKIKVVEQRNGCNVTVYVNNQKTNKQYDSLISPNDLEYLLRRDFAFIRENRYHMEYNGKKTYYYIEDKDKLSSTSYNNTTISTINDVAYVVAITHYYASYSIILYEYDKHAYNCEKIILKENKDSKVIPTEDDAKLYNSFDNVLTMANEYNDNIANFAKEYELSFNNDTQTLTTLSEVITNESYGGYYVGKEICGRFVSDFVVEYNAYNANNELIKYRTSGNPDIRQQIVSISNNQDIEFDIINSANDYNLYVTKEYKNILENKSNNSDLDM